MQPQLFALLITSLISTGALAMEIAENLPATAPSGLSLNVRTSMGFDAANNNHYNAIVFEPILRYGLSEENELNLYTVFYRSTEPSANSQIPKTLLTFKRIVPWLTDYQSTLRISTGPDNLADWRKDGYQFRTSATFEMARTGPDRLTATVRVGPFGVVSKNRFEVDGTEIKHFGATERIGFNYDLRRLQFDAVFIFQQAYGTAWSNDFANEEVISYRLQEQMTVGAAYALTSSVVDDGTGLYRPFVASRDERRHRVTAFLEFTF